MHSDAWHRRISAWEANTGRTILLVYFKIRTQRAFTYTTGFYCDNYPPPPQIPER